MNKKIKEKNKQRNLRKFRRKYFFYFSVLHEMRKFQKYRFTSKQKKIKIWAGSLNDWLVQITLIIFVPTNYATKRTECKYIFLKRIENILGLYDEVNNRILNYSRDIGGLFAAAVWLINLLTIINSLLWSWV